MVYPSKKDFINKTKKGNIVPVYKEITADCETPVSVYLKFKDKYKYLYLLESVEQNAQVGRYSFIGLGAKTIFKAKDEDIEIINGNKVEKKKSKYPMKELESLTKKFRPTLDEDMPPFYGGAVGFFSYDIVRQFEKLPYENKKGDIAVPDMYFVFAENIIIFDKMRNSIKIVSNVKVGNNKEKNYKDACKKLDDIENVLLSSLDVKVIVEPKKRGLKELKFKSNTTKKQYMDMVKIGKKYIQAGDVFQVVLSQRFELEEELDHFSVYRYMRTINPSPYMFYLNFDDTKLIGSSPEVMVKGDKDEILVRPIAGTRPRGKSVEEDNANEKELLNNEKECAEHVMLVDLGRNDVGRIADKASVHVDEFMVVERYSHVMHIVSQVKGKIKDKGLYDAFKATFPAGTLSGAPKIRAMEIIEELEKSHRGAYGGSVAYIGYSGNFDSCITIRTIIAKGKKLYFQAGAGIVADSDPEAEYIETVNKITAQFASVARALGMKKFKVVESKDGKSIVLVRSM